MYFSLFFITFSGLNQNYLYCVVLKLLSRMLYKHYSVEPAIIIDEYFGFTYPEVKSMLSYYGVSKKEAEIRECYDGYRFGNTNIYNPWSVINYISKKCTPQAYWVNTRKNEALGEVLKAASDDVKEKDIFFHSRRYICPQPYMHLSTWLSRFIHNNMYIYPQKYSCLST